MPCLQRSANVDLSDDKTLPPFAKEEPKAAPTIITGAYWAAQSQWHHSTIHHNVPDSLVIRSAHLASHSRPARGLL